jgi:CelD/BcsL family acetyltransferase involved in cellulose biosynthesis
MTAAPMDVRISGDWASIRAAWPGLSDLGPGVDGFIFQTREWIDAWFATLGEAGDTEGLFAVLGRGGADRAFLPFVIRRTHGLRILEGFGDGTADYHAPLVARGAAVGPAEAQALWAALNRAPRGPDAVHIVKAAAEIDGRPNPLLAWGATPYPMSGHVARLEGGWETWFGRHFGRDTQKTLARKRRKLGEIGPVETRYARDTAEALAWLGALIAGKAAQMQGAEVANGLAGARTAAFYERLTAAAPASGHVKVYALTVGGTPVALQWGVAAGGRFTNLLTSYAAGDWTRFSPGLLMFRDLLEDRFAHGDTVFDFGVGDEGYKARFSDDPALILNGVLRARTLRGHGYVAAQHARHRLRQAGLVQRLRRTLRGLRAGDRAGTTDPKAEVA